MRQLIIIILFLLQGSWLFAQQEKSLVHKGNELYQQKKFKNICIVFNGLKRRGILGNYGYGNYAGYGYGSYGYGEGGQDYYVTEDKKSIFSGIKKFFRK